MNIKILTRLIIIINVLSLSTELPIFVSLMVSAIALLSGFITQPKLRFVAKILLLVGSVASLGFHFKSLFVVECAVSLVMALSALKSWELDSESDHFNMFLILSLSDVGVFLLNPNLFVFCFSLTKLIFYFYYILKIRNYSIASLSIKKLITLIAPSLIFAIVLFYTFPRFTEGFINVETNYNQLFSGLNNRLNFKELGPLNLTGTPIFKATGRTLQTIPITKQYWRSSTLTRFSNQEWHGNLINLKSFSPIEESAEVKHSYQVEYLDDSTEFLPVLDGVTNISISNLAFSSYLDGTFKLNTPRARGNLFYQANSYYEKTLTFINPLLIRRSTSLSNKISPEVLNKWVEYNTNDSDQERLLKLQRKFLTAQFVYDLNPPTYKTIDDFLLKGKRGYCSHFASSFAYLARLYNLPSRLVVGYLGGEINPYDGSVLVRALDAHVWVEVFITKKGWVKIDPTVEIMPDRLSFSSLELSQKILPYLDFYGVKIPRSLYNIMHSNNASLYLDSLNSKFSSFLYSYDKNEQLALFKQYFPQLKSTTVIFTMSLLFIVIIYIFYFRFINKDKLTISEKRLKRFLKSMKKLKLEKRPGESLDSFKTRALETHPLKKKIIENEINLYQNSNYRNDN